MVTSFGSGIFHQSANWHHVELTQTARNGNSFSPDRRHWNGWFTQNNAGNNWMLIDMRCEWPLGILHTDSNGSDAENHSRWKQSFTNDFMESVNGGSGRRAGID
jgi:hypothetical protein